MAVTAPFTQLHIGEGYSVLVADDGRPQVVLNAEFLEGLAPVLQAAHLRALALSSGQDMQAIKVLCDRLQPVLETYAQSVREWIASRPLPSDMQQALATFDEIRKMLDE